MPDDAPPRGLRVALARRTTVEDVACGRCPACRAGKTYWCSEPAATGSTLATLGTDADPDWVRRWATALGALAEARPDPDDTVLLLSPAPSSAATRLVGLVHPGLVLATDGSDDDSRRTLREVSPTGRAQVVVALGQARTAVRSVQRGGVVCLPDSPDVATPSITELVQRDVRLVGPSAVDALGTPGTWERVGAALDELWAVEAGLQETAR